MPLIGMSRAISWVLIHENLDPSDDGDFDFAWPCLLRVYSYGVCTAGILPMLPCRELRIAFFSEQNLFDLPLLRLNFEFSQIKGLALAESPL